MENLHVDDFVCGSVYLAPLVNNPFPPAMVDTLMQSSKKYFTSSLLMSSPPDKLWHSFWMFLAYHLKVCHTVCLAYSDPSGARNISQSRAGDPHLVSPGSWGLMDGTGLSTWPTWLGLPRLVGFLMFFGTCVCPSWAYDLHKMLADDVGNEMKQIWVPWRPTHAPDEGLGINDINDKVIEF